MQLQPRHIDALDRAENLLYHFEFCPYLELKRLFADRTAVSRERFRLLFTRFYNLNTGGLTPEFLDRFFQILFGNNVIVDGRPDFETILSELCVIKRRKGDCAMPFSFVSKLAATHDETSPIYDRHVLSFFGRTVPPASIDRAKRIAWFIAFVECIRESYSAWADDARIIPILTRLKARDAKLSNLHPVRLMDFLVWKVGNARLLILAGGA